MMQLKPTKAITVFKHGKPFRFSEYFTDGRGQEVCRCSCSDPEYVLWQYRLKDDEPNYWRTGSLSNRRIKRLEAEYMNSHATPCERGEPEDRLNRIKYNKLLSMLRDILEIGIFTRGCIENMFEILGEKTSHE